VVAAGGSARCSEAWAVAGAAAASAAALADILAAGDLGVSVAEAAAAAAPPGVGEALSGYGGYECMM